jgi:GTP cyclohydrolase I
MAQHALTGDDPPRSPLTLASAPGSGEHLFERLLYELGENPAREGLVRTPSRAWESLSYLTEGYSLCAADVIGEAVFTEPYDEMIVIRDIEFYSLCEHHLLPFFGRVTVGYIPDGRIVGLSKVPRLVDMFSHRLQVQERLTMQIADALREMLMPKGVGVQIEASHLCMMMRGVEKQNSTTDTLCTRGVFESDLRVRREFLDRRIR